MSASAHHSMERRGSDPRSYFGVRRAHAAFYTTADMNGRHREVYYCGQFGRLGARQTSSVSDTSEGENSVRKLVVLEPVYKKLRRAAQPHCHSKVLPALFGAKCAREIVEHKTFLASSKFDSAPHSYGCILFHIGNFATGGRVA